MGDEKNSLEEKIIQLNEIAILKNQHAHKCEKHQIAAWLIDNLRRKLWEDKNGRKNS